MIRFFIFCIVLFIMMTPLISQDQNAFISPVNGNTLFFTKMNNSGQVKTVYDIFWLYNVDSLRTPGVKFFHTGCLSPDCEGEFPTFILIKNRKYGVHNFGIYSSSLKKGEILGAKKKIWELNAWGKIKPFLKKGIAMGFVTPDLLSKCPLHESDITNPRKIFNIDKKTYLYYEKLRGGASGKRTDGFFYLKGQETLSADSELFLLKLLEQSSQPTFEAKKIEPTNFDDWISRIEHAKIPILCIDPKNHATRLDKNDWKFNGFLDQGNGDFYLYSSFEKLNDYPGGVSARQIALDYLAGVNDCRQSVVGVILEPGKRMVLKHEDIKMSSPLIFALDKNGKIWKPNSPPTDKNTIPNDRLQFVLNKYMLFGSWCPIWELNIWRRVGMMLKSHPEGIYLVGYGTLLQAEETQTVEEEHAFIQKHGVLITPELYTALEYLRGKQ